MNKSTSELIKILLRGHSQYYKHIENCHKLRYAFFHTITYLPHENSIFRTITYLAHEN